MLIPTLQNPITDFTGVINTLPSVKPYNYYCTKLRLKYLNCVEAYGLERGYLECASLYFDSLECRNAAMQKARSEAIKKERMKQYKEGKLKKPFDEHPPFDTFLFSQFK